MKKKIWKFVEICFICVILSSVPSIHGMAVTNDKADGVVNTKIIKCPTYETGSQNENEAMPQFMIQIPSGEDNIVFPIKVTSKGVLNTILFETGEVSEDAALNYKITVSMFKDSSCKEVIDVKECDNFFGIYYQNFYILEQGTYYIQLTTYNHAGMNDIDLCFMPTLIQSSNRELRENIWAYAASFDKKDIYYKVNVSSDGYITANIDSNEDYQEGEINITLCDAKKKALSSTYDIVKNNNEAIYAVNPGEYYIRVRADFKLELKTFSDYRIKYDYTKLKDGSGKNLKEATKIKSEKVNEGLQTVKNNFSDWYKFTVTSNKSININIKKAMTSGDFTLIIYDSKMNKVLANSNTICKPNQKVTTYTTVSKLKKGTYYIEINKEDSKSTGHYQLVMK